MSPSKGGLINGLFNNSIREMQMKTLEFKKDITMSSDTYKRWTAGHGSIGRPQYSIAMYTDYKTVKRFYRVYHGSASLNNEEYSSFEEAEKAAVNHLNEENKKWDK